MIVKSKIQNSKSKNSIQNAKFLILIFSFAFLFLNFKLTCYAKEITILFSGETHAMLYPCNCPIEPDGGVARRAALIKQLKRVTPDALVFDSGAFFAGGIMDENSQTDTLDKQRTLINVEAMDLMGYDAAVIGDDELNFGREFLEQLAAKAKFAFLSANLKLAKISPYIIKDLSGIKVGIIGLTNQAAVNKAVGVEFINPAVAAKGAVEELKKRKVDLIIVLSHLGEDGDLSLISEIPEIGVLISGHSVRGEKTAQKIGSSILLKPSWEGRKLGKLTISLKNGQIKDYKAEELRLSDKIKDDPAILAILPRCFLDSDCKKQGFIGSCKNPGELAAQCKFQEAPRISLTVISSRECKTCNADSLARQMKTIFPGLVVSYLYYPENKAKDLMRDLGISGLPAYLFSSEIEKEKKFAVLKEKLEKRAGFYMIRQEFSGVSFFTDRKKEKGKIDVFLSLFDRSSPQLLDALKSFNPEIHFLSVENNGRFEAQNGNLEVEESLRSVCVKKYYPEKFWDYIGCRAKNIDSYWWEDCLSAEESGRVKACAKSQEGKSLLRENIKLNKELRVIYGPAYLLDNKELFSTQSTLTKEGLKKAFRR